MKENACGSVTQEKPAYAVAVVRDLPPLLGSDLIVEQRTRGFLRATSREEMIESHLPGVAENDYKIE